MNLHSLVKLVVISCACGAAGLIVGYAQPSHTSRAAALRRAGESAPSQAGIMSGPVLGLVANEDGTMLQKMVGVPGAALIEARFALPENVRRLYLAPAQRWSLVDKADGSGMAFLALEGETSAELIDVNSSIASPDVVVFSPGGNRAAIYSRSEQRLQIVVIENHAARVDREVPISQLTSSKVRLLAMDDSAEAPVVVTDSGQSFAIRGQFISDIPVLGQDISD